MILRQIRKLLCRERLVRPKHGIGAQFDGIADHQIQWPPYLDLQDFQLIKIIIKLSKYLTDLFSFKFNPF